MALVFLDRVKETWTGTGTGTITLAGAATGFRAFSTLTSGDLCTFCIEDGTNWEVSEGVYTTSGTTLTRATVIASSNAGSLVSFPAGTKNVFLVQSARDVGLNLPSLYDVSQGVSGSVFATMRRFLDVSSAVVNALTTQRQYMAAIMLPRGFKVSNIIWYSGTNAAVTPTNQWSTLSSSALVRRAISADDTTNPWASNAAKPFAMTTPYVTTTAGLHYLGLMVKAATVPQLCGNINALLTAGTPRTLAPLPTGLASDTGLTDPASCPSTAGAITGSGSYAYAEVS